MAPDVASDAPGDAGRVQGGHVASSMIGQARCLPAAGRAVPGARARRGGHRPPRSGASTGPKEGTERSKGPGWALHLGGPAEDRPQRLCLAKTAPPAEVGSPQKVEAYPHAPQMVTETRVSPPGW